MIVIHIGAVLDLLIQEGAPDNTIFHCYSGDAQMAKECIANNYILSFAGTLTFKNAPELREAVVLVPVEQLLVETDSPFLSTDAKSRFIKYSSPDSKYFASDGRSKR